MTQIVTRFAPSPTGAAHAGSYRSAMYAWLFARKHGGKFILRIEDTDTARNQEGSSQGIKDSLAWLGLDYDQLYIQSENLGRHQEVIAELIARDAAYVSVEEAKDGSGVMKEIVRFRNPNKVITVHDLIRGEVSVDVSDLGDFVIARSMTEPIFHLANVIDDHDEGVTHVIRAEEHLANTPRQIAIFEALGWEIPVYAHLPLVLGTDKLKLSKRRGAPAMMEYAAMGYLPAAVFNCVAMCGWNPGEGTEQEIFSRDELIAQFDLSRVQKSGAVFNPEKLDWYNREYIKMLSDAEFMAQALPFVPTDSGFDTELVIKLLPIIRERVVKFSDITTMITDGELGYFAQDPVIDSAMLVWKDTGLDAARENLQLVGDMLRDYDGQWDVESLKSLLMPFAEDRGKGNVLWPLRVALSGREKSPDPFTLLAILGKSVALTRITTAISI